MGEVTRISRHAWSEEISYPNFPQQFKKQYKVIQGPRYGANQ